MGKKISAVILALMVPTIAAADSAVPFLPNEYTILCESQMSVGFDWQSGNWHFARYKPTKRIITKSEPNFCHQVTPLTSDINLDTFVTRQECLNVRDFGAPYHKDLSHYCTVIYSKSGESWEVEILCDDPTIKFRPDGWYHFAHIHDSLSDAPPKDYKDSQYVEVGKCARIK